MKYIINKGMAGLGNRLQSLGLAADKALEYNAELAVDWTDPSWLLGFDAYFRIDSRKLKLVSPEELPDDLVVKPDKWRDFWKIPAGGEKNGIKGIKVQSKTVDPDCGGHIICCYKYPHSDFIYRTLRPSKEALAWRTAVLRDMKVPSLYDAYHIRHTDKKTDDWKRKVRQARRRQERDGIPVLILTDSVAVRDSAVGLGLTAPSWILEPDRPGGVHHKKVDRDTKHLINLSAIADLWTAVKARKFVACCPDSTFSIFAERKRARSSK